MDTETRTRKGTGIETDTETRTVTLIQAKPGVPAKDSDRDKDTEKGTGAGTGTRTKPSVPANTIHEHYQEDGYSRTKHELLMRILSCSSLLGNQQIASSPPPLQHNLRILDIVK